MRLVDTSNAACMIWMMYKRVHSWGAYMQLATASNVVHRVVLWQDQEWGVHAIYWEFGSHSDVIHLNAWGGGVSPSILVHCPIGYRYRSSLQALKTRPVFGLYRSLFLPIFFGNKDPIHYANKHAFHRD